MSNESLDLAIEIAWERLTEQLNDGEFDYEFDMWCTENGIHHDDAPDYEESFLERKLEQIIDNWE